MRIENNTQVRNIKEMGIVKSNVLKYLTSGVTWTPIRMDEGHIHWEWGGCLCQALTLCLLNHVEVLSGAVQGQLEALKGWEKTSRTWLFIKPLGFHHILKYFNT